MSVRERTIEILEERIQGESQILVSAEAIDVILQLLKEQQWISVKEKLPDRYKMVITCDTDGRTHENLLINDHPRWLKGHNITHWMPMPEPPEEVMPDE